MVASRSTAVACVVLGLALVVSAGCPTRGSKLIANESSIRTSLQDINNIMSGYVSLAEGQEIAISRERISVPVTVHKATQSDRELELIGERICQHVVETLTGLDINPQSDVVTVEVHLLPPPDPSAAPDAAPPVELGTSTYDSSTGEAAFAKAGV
jgi:hypothetical protein